MNYESAYGFNIGNCPPQLNHCHKPPWYCKFIKPFFSFVISVMLALSISHLCEKFSTNNSFQTIKSDLSTLRTTVSLISNEVRTLMEIKDEFRGKLKEVVCIMPKLTEAIHNLRHEVSEGIDVRTHKLIQILAEENVKKVVKDELELYDADKTGKFDFALESAGGSVISTRDTENYPICGHTLKLFGLPLCNQANSPRAIIQPGVLPGECWSFKGSEGVAVIQLVGHVLISGFSLEHISPRISITGETNNAPKVFSVWGLKNKDDRNGLLLGKYIYDNSGSPLQYFDVQSESNRAYSVIELKIHSNNGNEKCTCVYRIRVHGTLTSHMLDYARF